MLPFFFPRLELQLFSMSTPLAMIVVGEPTEGTNVKHFTNLPPPRAAYIKIQAIADLDLEAV